MDQEIGQLYNTGLCEARELLNETPDCSITEARIADLVSMSLAVDYCTASAHAGQLSPEDAVCVLQVMLATAYRMGVHDGRAPQP